MKGNYQKEKEEIWLCLYSKLQCKMNIEIIACFPHCRKTREQYPRHFNLSHSTYIWGIIMSHKSKACEASCIHPITMIITILDKMIRNLVVISWNKLVRARVLEKNGVPISTIYAQTLIKCLNYNLRFRFFRAIVRIILKAVLILTK